MGCGVGQRAPLKRSEYVVIKFSTLSTPFHKSSSPVLPVLATVPRSGTWFLRYSISFLCHLAAGGRIDDRVTGETFGTPAGRPFDFERFLGGPLFCVRGALPAEHLFIGHTVCPGFDRVASEVPWWSATDFHVPGYDYFHNGFDYAWTPVDLAEQRYAAVCPQALDRSPWVDAGQRIVLVYRDPLGQLDSFYHYSRTHSQAVYRTFDGRKLSDVPFESFLFGGGLASYAKQFMSYQTMAAHLPGQVRLVSYERLMAEPVEALGDILGFLGADADVDRSLLASAIALARCEHLKAIEHELGRSLDGTHSARHGHMRPNSARSTPNGAARRAAIDWLLAKGLDPKYFAWDEAPAPTMVECVAELAPARRASSR